MVFLRILSINNLVSRSINNIDNLAQSTDHPTVFERTMLFLWSLSISGIHQWIMTTTTMLCLLRIIINRLYNLTDTIFSLLQRLFHLQVTEVWVLLLYSYQLQLIWQWKKRTVLGIPILRELVNLFQKQLNRI